MLPPASFSQTHSWRYLIFVQKPVSLSQKQQSTILYISIFTFSDNCYVANCASTFICFILCKFSSRCSVCVCVCVCVCVPVHACVCVRARVCVVQVADKPTWKCSMTVWLLLVTKCQNLNKPYFYLITLNVCGIITVCTRKPGETMDNP